LRHVDIPTSNSAAQLEELMLALNNHISVCNVASWEKLFANDLWRACFISFIVNREVNHSVTDQVNVLALSEPASAVAESIENKLSLVFCIEHDEAVFHYENRLV
jgi:hypothetical protein